MSRKKGVPFWVVKPHTEVGWLIRNWRLHNDLTVNEAAARIGIDPMHLNALETGRLRGRRMSFSIQEKLAAGIGIPLRRLAAALPWRGKRTSLGELVVYSRADMILSRSALAKKTGLPDGFLSAVEEGRRKRLSFYDAVELAVGLNVQLSVFELFIGARHTNEKAGLSPRGRVIRDRRKYMHMSQGQLAKALHTSRQMISAIERGHVKLSRSPLFNAVAAFLRCDPNLLR